MQFLCNTHHSTISEFSSVGTVIIALANLFFAGYIFIHKNRQDQQRSYQTAKLNEQNIKLQWFKELIVQPCMPEIEVFFKNLHTIYEKIQSNDLIDEEKEDLNRFVKKEASNLRKSFIDVLIGIDEPLSVKVKECIDGLVDNITKDIFDDELKLKNPLTYEKHIGSQISYSRNRIISILYNYKGLPD